MKIFGGVKMNIIEGMITNVESGNSAIAITLDQDHGHEIRLIIQSKDIKSLDLFVKAKRLFIGQNEDFERPDR